MRYLHLDVFTASAFEGNQLAVFPEPPALDTTAMQRIAAEMAFSETTFVYPAEHEGDVKMRIFTPGCELPIAGHPTIGTTFALALEGRIPRGQEHFVYELGVGPTPVSLEWDAHGLRFVWMRQPLPVFGATIEDRSALAAAVGVERRDLPDELPVQVVSCGVPYLLVPLRTRAAVDRVSIDRRSLLQCYAAAGIEEVPVFTFSTGRGAGPETIYSRMLAPGFGIAEDPATGSASGPLGSYLLRYGAVPEETARGMVSLQGAAMGRPSRLHISIEGAPTDITRVRVGGQSVLVGRGELSVQPVSYSTSSRTPPTRPANTL